MQENAVAPRKDTTLKGAGKIQYPAETNPTNNPKKIIFWNFLGLIILHSIQNKSVNTTAATENPRANAIAPSVVNLGNFSNSIKTAAKPLSPITTIVDINPALRIR